MLTNMRIRMAQIRMVLWDWRNGRSGGQEDVCPLAWGLCRALQSPILSKLTTRSGGDLCDKTRLSKRSTEMFGPHNRCVAPANEHAGRGARCTWQLCIDVEVRQLAGSPFQPTGPHSIARAPCAE